MVEHGGDSYAVAAQEDRSARRTEISIPAMIRPSGGRRFQTVVHDLSLSGFSAMSISRLHEGTLCWLTIPGLESMQARVVWWEASMVGCAFDKLLSPLILEATIERWRGEGYPRSG
ncbi:MAG TPA: PilZ domain-containing protein [Novosphingobium sp.]|nr:PilZ domain-containing protein [Novosphingobium sp.]